MSSAWDRPAIVIDVGSNCTKLGFAGNDKPTFSLPTVVSRSKDSRQRPEWDVQELIGEQALATSSLHGLAYPVRNGIVQSWDVLERFLQHSLFQYLRVEPEDHVVLLTEPACSTSDSREMLAEIMFETFGVAGLHIGTQPVLALYASLIATHRTALDLAAQTSTAQQTASNAGTLQAPGAKATAGPGASSVPSASVCMSPQQCTGLVVDVGEYSTSVVPVVDGFVVGSGVKRLALGGRDLTQLVQQALRDRGSAVHPDMSWEVARQIKEAHCYVCPSTMTEAAKWAAQPAKYARSHRFLDPRVGPKEVVLELGTERYLAPELFFTPAGHPLASSQASQDGQSAAGREGEGALPSRVPSTRLPLHTLVDQVVQSCPIDTRRALYASVVMSGGTAAIRNFGKRMQVELAAAANSRLSKTAKPIEVGVMSTACAGHAAWLGGSLLAGGAAPAEEWQAAVVSRQQYQEQGAAVYRRGF
ncbi:actin family [Haematococcus lacustris]